MAPVKTIARGSHTLEYYYYSKFDPRGATTWPSVDRCPSKYKKYPQRRLGLYISQETTDPTGDA
jgi:hypothetical protein